MGDPKKQKKKFSKPSHPWQSLRIEEERKLIKDYALKNKKEIWKAQSKIQKFKKKAKELIALQSAQAKKEEEQLLNKLVRLNLLPKESKIENVLDLSIYSILDRRLQTLAYKKGLAKSISQARQFIVHGHIAVSGKKVDVPSYLVPTDEESNISFLSNSTLSDEEHPERIKKESLKQKKEKQPPEKKVDKENERSKVSEELEVSIENVTEN